MADVKTPPPGDYQHGGWYWNPAIGQAQRYWNGSFLPAGQTEPGQYLQGQEPKQTSSGAQHIPTAEEILGDIQKQLKEQVSFLKDFLDKNPLAFDESLARQMATEKFQPYYQEILTDFVEPLQTKVTRSFADQQALLAELVRQGGYGSRKISDETTSAVAKAREGFAGAGLLGSGIETGVTGRREITGKNDLQDFQARNTFAQTQTQTEQERIREDAQKAIEQKNRDIFGPGREFATQTAKDVETQRQTALKQRGLRAIEAVSSQFGTPLESIPNYLNLYNT